jgi:hypothetical protein
MVDRSGSRSRVISRGGDGGCSVVSRGIAEDDDGVSDVDVENQYGPRRSRAKG